MKIDEGCINHNVFNLAKDSSEWILESSLNEESFKNAAINLAYIAGVCELAKRLKGVLKE